MLPDKVDKAIKPMPVLMVQAPPPVAILMAPPAAVRLMVPISTSRLILSRILGRALVALIVTSAPTSTTGGTPMRPLDSITIG